jgi:hypothetical protein
MASRAGLENALKRRASNVSDFTAAAMPPRKRLRQDEIPVWARSARQLPLKIVAPRSITPPMAHNDPVAKQNSMGQLPPAMNGQGQHHPPTPPLEPEWEVSIIGQHAADDLARAVADWIYQQIGERAEPGGGALFEIEAKVGKIWDEDNDCRLQLAVGSETVFEKHLHRGRTSFKSTMNEVGRASWYGSNVWLTFHLGSAPSR